MTRQPSASVVIPTWNRSVSLRACVGSLLDQDFPPHDYEVIVIDDGSSDDTARAVAELGQQSKTPVRYVRQRHRGPNAARNAGLRAASSDLICFVDDDEDVPPSWLQAIVDGAARFPDAGGLGGPMRLRLDGTPPRMCGREPLGESELDYGAVAHEVDCLWGGNLAVRRWAVDRVGPFREDLRMGGTEVEWEQRLRAAGHPIVYLPDAWLWHRRSQAQLRLHRLMLNRFFRGRGQALNGHRLGRPLEAGPTARWLREDVGHSVRYRCSVGLISAAQHGGRLLGILETTVRRRPRAGS
jgi:glycosyltransferase involved in cell wall biosynthesis